MLSAHMFQLFCLVACGFILILNRLFLSLLHYSSLPKPTCPFYAKHNLVEEIANSTLNTGQVSKLVLSVWLILYVTSVLTSIMLEGGPWWGRCPLSPAGSCPSSCVHFHLQRHRQTRWGRRWTKAPPSYPSFLCPKYSPGEREKKHITYSHA